MSQGLKLKSAYESMIKFEEQRSKDRKEREQLQEYARREKNREMALNFHKAENIRAEFRANKH